MSAYQQIEEGGPSGSKVLSSFHSLHSLSFDLHSFSTSSSSVLSSANNQQPCQFGMILSRFGLTSCCLHAARFFLFFLLGNDSILLISLGLRPSRRQRSRLLPTQAGWTSTKLRCPLGWILKQLSATSWDASQVRSCAVGWLWISSPSIFFFLLMFRGRLLDPGAEERLRQVPRMAVVSGVFPDLGEPVTPYFLVLNLPSNPSSFFLDQILHLAFSWQMVVSIIILVFDLLIIGFLM